MSTTTSESRCPHRRVAPLFDVVLDVVGFVFNAGNPYDARGSARCRPLVTSAAGDAP